MRSIKSFTLFRLQSPLDNLPPLFLWPAKIDEEKLEEKIIKKNN
jgi:hypothetical protein